MKGNDKIKSIFEFLKLAEKLKTELRHNWTSKPKRQESVAELEGETGIKVGQKDLIPLGKIAVHPSKSKCVVHGFLIKDVEFNSQQNLDVTEQINVVQLSVEEAFAAIKSGEIWAVDTVAFLFKAKELL